MSARPTIWKRLTVCHRHGRPNQLIANGREHAAQAAAGPQTDDSLASPVPEASWLLQPTQHAIGGPVSPQRHHYGCAKGPAPHFETMPPNLSRLPQRLAALVRSLPALCLLASSIPSCTEPVCAPLNDMNVAGPQVRQPPLQLLCPHQAQTGRHNNQQGPLLLQAMQQPCSAGEHRLNRRSRRLHCCQDDV